MPDCVHNLVPILKDYTSSFQIIIVDDGSSDNTYNVAKELSEQYQSIEVIKNTKNLGIGRSYKKAISYANSKYITWFPTDGEIAAKELIDSLKLLDQYLCIVTYPVNGELVRSKFRFILSTYYQKLYRLLFVANVKYFNACTIFNTEMLKAIKTKSTGFTFSAETVITYLHSYKMNDNLLKQMPITLSPRHSGTASAIRIKVLIEIFCFIFRMKLKYLRRLNLK